MNFKTIRCPKCNYEYLLSEIFIPDYITTKPTRIIRDEEGSIITFEGIQQDLEEEFTCEHCNANFKVTLDLTTKVELNESKTFEDYSSDLVKERIVLQDEFK